MSYLDDLNQEELAEVEHDKIEAEVGNIIYKAALIFERLENAGVIAGNGHHMAQQCATHATAMLEGRWCNGD
jgi:L-arabinose isomerase